MHTHEACLSPCLVARGAMYHAMTYELAYVLIVRTRLYLYLAHKQAARTRSSSVLIAITRALKQRGKSYV